MNSETFLSSTGAKLNLYSSIPDEEVKAIIHIAHGMVEHAGRYARFANELCKSGYAVYSCLLYTSPSPRDLSTSRMPSSA